MSSTVADLSENALRDSIVKKGKNSYYFAHAHKANGPKWDGKPQPRLLSKHAISSDEGVELENAANMENATLMNKLNLSNTNFAYSESNITKYAFLDEKKRVKLYVEMKGVGEACSNDDICLEWDENSFKLIIKNYPSVSNSEEDAISDSTNFPVQCLNLGKLYGFIEDATFKKKKDRVIVTLVKRVEGDEDPPDWPSIRANSGGEDEA